MPLDGDSAVGQMIPSATGRQNRRHIGSVEARGTEANFLEPARRAFPDDADAQAGSPPFSLPRFVDDRGTSVCRSHSYSRWRPPTHTLTVDGARDAGPPSATFPAFTGSTLNRSPGPGPSPRPLLVLAHYLDTLRVDNESEIRSRESMLWTICSVYRGSPSDHGHN